MNFPDQMKADQKALFASGEMTESIVYGTQAKTIKASVTEASSEFLVQDSGEGDKKEFLVVILTDAADGIANPQREDPVTIRGIQCYVSQSPKKDPLDGTASFTAASYEATRRTAKQMILER